MDILSFTTIIVVLFIIIGGYLIFTNQIEGRPKIIIIVAVFICFIYIFMNLNMFKSYTEATSSPTEANTMQTVTGVDTTSTSFSLSTWIYITDWNPGISKTIFSGTDNCPTLTLDSTINNLIINYTTSESTSESITIKDISIQKWVNIVICFGDNNVDSYINGKLVDSHINNGSVQLVSSVADNTTLSWGGFTGYISSSRYYPTFLSPQEVWDIYAAGFSSNLLGNFLNQYNATFTFSQNHVEKASFNII